MKRKKFASGFVEELYRAGDWPALLRYWLLDMGDDSILKLVASILRQKGSFWSKEGRDIYKFSLLFTFLAGRGLGLVMGYPALGLGLMKRVLFFSNQELRFRGMLKV